MMSRFLGGWKRFTNPRELIPLDDLKPHIFGLGCWCKPCEVQDIICHNAMDQREEYEEGRHLH